VGVAAERAYEERQRIIERVTDELDGLRDAGKLTGRPSFGYASEGDKYDRRLVPADEGRTYVPLIFAHCIDGWSLRRIALWLTAEGVKPPLSGAWNTRTIANIIKNPVYKGHRCEYVTIPPDETEERDGRAVRYRYGSRWVDTPRWEFGRTIHRCEALVDAATWDAANRALTRRPKRGHTDPEKRAMLAGALSCAHCDDSPMYRQRAGAASKAGRMYAYYYCVGRGVARRSCGNLVRVEAVDAAVNQIIASTFNVPVIEYRVTRGNEAELEARLAAIKFEVRQLGALDLADDEYDQRLAELRNERNRITDPEITPRIPDSVQPAETGDTYAGLYAALPIPERGPWLAANGFRVFATKTEVTVRQGTVSATIALG
jgi:hypothetical protein